jgi:5-formyltetrahydrofolate cyclo-ligase
MSQGANDWVLEAKAAMRCDIANALMAISPAARLARSAVIGFRVRELDTFAKAACVMVYMPFGTEVDLGPVATAVLRRGGRICVPRFDLSTGAMWAVELKTWEPDRWSRGRFGVPEAPATEPLDPATIDLVIVPGIAFDPAGNRLGRGKGFYDRFLRDPRLGATTIGVCFEEQVVAQVPCVGTDERLEWLVTDARVLGPWPSNRPFG